MKFLTLIYTLIAFAHATYLSNATCSTPITTTKVNPSYWRATFSCPPLNVEGLAFFQAYYTLINEIEADPNVKVVVFDSSVPGFWLDHFDVLKNVPPELSWDVYWSNVTRLYNLPVLTVASIRGIATGGGAEIAATLDVRFGSREKAKFSQTEVSVGECYLKKLVSHTRVLR